MDISKASNFERYVFDLVNRDAAHVAELFGSAVEGDGGFSLSPEEFGRIALTGFTSGRSTHADRLAMIRYAWEQDHDMIDPHTADGLKVAREHLQPGVPMVVLETALPAKFASTIEEALGRQPPRPQSLEGIEALPKRFVVMPVDVQRVKDYIRENSPA